MLAASASSAWEPWCHHGIYITFAFILITGEQCDLNCYCMPLLRSILRRSLQYHNSQHKQRWSTAYTRVIGDVWAGEKDRYQVYPNIITECGIFTGQYLLNLCISLSNRRFSSARYFVLIIYQFVDSPTDVHIVHVVHRGC